MGEQPSTRRTTSLRRPPLLAVSGAYLCLSTVGYMLAQSRSGMPLQVWFPPAGLAFGYLLVAGARGVPVVVLAGALGHALVHGPTPGLPHESVTLLAVLATAGWYGATALTQRRLWRADASYGSMAWFVLFGVIAAPVGTAAIVVAAKVAEGGGPPDLALWAGAVLGSSTAIVTLAPAVYLVVDEVVTGRRLAPTVSTRRRLGIVTQAAAIVLTPAVFLIAGAAQAGELTLMPLALIPLAWMALSRDQTRGAIVLAATGLVLGASAQIRYGESAATFRLQSVMFAGAVATLFAGVGVATESLAGRMATLQSTRWRALVEAAPAVVARIGVDGHWVAEPTTAAGRPDPESVDVVARAGQIPSLVAAARAGAPATAQWGLDDDTGRRFVTHLTPTPDGGGIAVTTETTMLHSAEIALAWERSHDRETDLPNRDLLVATADQALRDGSASCLILLDLDRLSRRAALVDGDPARLLLHLAERARGLLPDGAPSSGQSLIARVGDDQLGVLVAAGVEESRAIATRIVQALRQPVPAPVTPLLVTAWAGVSPLEPGRAAAESLRRAWAALQAAIEGRREQVVVLDGLSFSTSAERARLAGEVVGALHRGELEVVFQPDVRLPGGELSGVEALVRWRREGFAAATDLFIELAEEVGAVQAIDAWVMEESLREVGSWRREHDALDLEVALNVSALSLTDDLPDRLFEACLRHDVPPWNVRLEVTETALADASSAPGVLRRVRSRGCRVALDDFGTGYATLSRLHRLPVDVVKLDRSFIPPITDDLASQALVSLVLGLAGPLQVEVVVEGVETEEQRDVLIDLGCRRAQGFLFSRPAPAATIRRLIGAGRRLDTARVVPEVTPAP